jgi:CBS domain-containing protein
MRAEDIMSSPVVKVRPETPAKAATALLAAHGFTALPVVDQDDRLLGVVTEADLMRDRILPDPRARIWRDREPVPHYHSPDTVERVMSSPATGMDRYTDAAELAKVMLREDIRSIPILDGSRVVGIVTRRDLLRTIARDDLAIVADVRHQLAAYAGGDRWTVTVADGAVRILDEFDDDTDRHVAMVLARAVPGVQSVEVTPRVDQSV